MGWSAVLGTLCARTSEMPTEGGVGCLGRGQRRQEQKLCALWAGTVGSKGGSRGQNALKTSLKCRGPELTSDSHENSKDYCWCQ